MNLKLVRYILPIAIILIASCTSSKIVLSSNANIDKYKYVIFGNEYSGDRKLDDVIMEVENQIAETNLEVLLTSNTAKISECSDSILTPNIHVTSGELDGVGHTYIIVTFYDYKNDKRIAVVKSSGKGMPVNYNQNIVLDAIKKQLNKLFQKH